jgi:hypothetical protein
MPNKLRNPLVGLWLSLAALWALLGWMLNKANKLGTLGPTNDPDLAAAQARFWSTVTVVGIMTLLALILTVALARKR